MKTPSVSLPFPLFLVLATVTLLVIFTTTIHAAEQNDDPRTLDKELVEQMKRYNPGTHVVESLIQRGANVNVVGEFLKGKHMNPLHKACWDTDSQMDSLLLNAGADVGAMDCNGHTPLDIAKYRLFSQWRDSCGYGGKPQALIVSRLITHTFAVIYAPLLLNIVECVCASTVLNNDITVNVLHRVVLSLLDDEKIMSMDSEQSETLFVLIQRFVSHCCGALLSTTD